MERQITLTKSQVATILATIECFQEQNHYNYEEMNRTMGNMTIQDMTNLQSELHKWFHAEDVVDEYEDVDMDEYRESYSDYISSYIY